MYVCVCVYIIIYWCIWKVGEGFQCVFQCDVPHQWIAQCMYTVTGWGAMSCVCGMALLCQNTTTGQNTTATSRRYRLEMTSDV